MKETNTIVADNHIVSKVDSIHGLFEKVRDAQVIYCFNDPALYCYQINHAIFSPLLSGNTIVEFGMFSVCADTENVSWKSNIYDDDDDDDQQR